MVAHNHSLSLIITQVYTVYCVSYYINKPIFTVSYYVNKPSFTIYNSNWSRLIAGIIENERHIRLTQNSVFDYKYNKDKQMLSATRFRASLVQNVDSILLSIECSVFLYLSVCLSPSPFVAVNCYKRVWATTRYLSEWRRKQPLRMKVYMALCMGRWKRMSKIHVLCTRESEPVFSIGPTCIQVSGNFCLKNFSGVNSLHFKIFIAEDDQQNLNTDKVSIYST